jgi:hypothetical protein
MEPDSDLIAYVNGLTEKCAEYGVDPQVVIIEIVKEAQSAPQPQYEDVGYNLRNRLNNWFMGLAPVEWTYNNFFRPKTYFEGEQNPAMAAEQRRAAWNRARAADPTLRATEQGMDRAAAGNTQSFAPGAWQPPGHRQPPAQQNNGYYQPPAPGPGMQPPSRGPQPPQPPQPPAPGQTR